MKIRANDHRQHTKRPEDEMGRVHEEHMARPRLGGVQARLQLGVEKSRLGLDVLGQLFLGGTGITRTRWNFSPMSLRNFRTWLGPRRSPVSSKMRSQAWAMVWTGLLLEGLADQVAIGGHLALGTMVVALPEAFQAPRAKGGDVAMDGGLD